MGGSVPLRDPKKTKVWLIAVITDINTTSEMLRDLNVRGSRFPGGDYSETRKRAAVPLPTKLMRGYIGQIILISLYFKVQVNSSFWYQKLQGKFVLNIP